MLAVHFICDLLEGGAQKSALSLIENTNDTIRNHLVLLEDRRKYEPTFVSIRSVTENKKVFKKLGVIGDYLLAKKLLRVIQQIEAEEGRRVDVIISHMEVTAKVLYFLRRYCRVYYIRVNLEQELNGLQKLSARRAERRRKLYSRILNGQNLITVSKGVLEDLPSIPVSPAYSECIYNAFNTENIRVLGDDPKIRVPEIDYIVHPTSYRNSSKRHDILFQALQLMQSKMKVIMLSEPVSALTEMIDQYGVSDRVALVGFHENPYPIIKNAKLTVLSSEREGLPRVLVESLILNTPVVSTNCPSGPEEIMTGDLSAYLAKVNDPADLALKLDAALSSYPAISETYIEPFRKDRNIELFKRYLSQVS